MLKEKRGNKLVCPNCSKKFYDLNREDFDCPMCHERYVVETEEEDEVEEVVPETTAKTDEKKSKDKDELLDDDDDLADLVLDEDDEDNEKDKDKEQEGDDTLLQTDEDDNMSDIIDIPSTDNDDS